MATHWSSETRAETVKSTKSPLTVQVAAYSHTPWALQLVLNLAVQALGSMTEVLSVEEERERERERERESCMNHTLYTDSRETSRAATLCHGYSPKKLMEVAPLFLVPWYLISSGW